ncbi:hypothetical protein BD413DRAFT_245063 [Trametes elegans]|nr:hypothetical protein BD413DRAFT_245063 [Trametes elegans]
MRLIHTRTGSLHWIDKPSHGSYAIVSCLWSPENDRSYQDILHCQNTRSTSPMAADTDQEPTLDPRLSPLIQNACQVVSEAGYGYVWFQSCCVDRINGAELSDALNSLWDWYSNVGTCFAYLADVPPGDQVFGPDSQFRRSEWHQDAWTLQALVAPRNVVFLARDWSVLGTKGSLASPLEAITAVDRAVLKGEHSAREASVARRMWWASRRHFPCPEDEAYALLGLFDVNIPVTYGEGVHAFMQLQEEIFRSTADQTLFAWHYHLGHEDPDCLLAAGPCCFARSGGVKPIQYHDFITRLGLPSGDDNAPPLPRQLTSSGVSIRCALIPHAITTYPPTAALYEVFGVAARFSHVGVLQCEDDSGRLVVLSLDAVRGEGYAAKAVETTLGQCDRVWAWSPALYREAAAVRDVVMRRGPLGIPWIGRARPAAEASAESPKERGDHARIVLQEGVSARLAERGFNVARELARRELVDDLYPRERRARRLADAYVFSLSRSPAALPGASLTVEVLTRRFDLRPVTLDVVEVYHPVSSDAAGSSSARPAIQPYQSSRDDRTRTLYARYIIEEDSPQGACVLELHLSGRADINAGYFLDMEVLSLQGAIVHSLSRGADKSLKVQHASSARQSYGAGRVMDVWPRVPGLGGWTSRHRRVVVGT